MIPFRDPDLSPAQANLARQLDQHELYLCSLDEMWRACDAPEGREPHLWLERMADLVHEMRRYIETIGEGYHLPFKGGEPGPIWPWPEYLDLRGDWQAGDTLAIPPLAMLYALYLDSIVE